MQSVLVYGRLLARAIATGISNEVYNQHSIQWPVVDKKNYARCVHLVTASSGFSKTHTPSQVVNKYAFGDDACFIARHERGDVIGVADGVGGWRAYGIDPSQFPYSLMSTCERLVKEGRFLPVNPVDILGASYYELLESKAPLIGSCTACLLALHREDKTLYTANLGDSGFLVVREGEVVHRSEEQQHYFNTPFQLSVAPTVLEGTVISDSPESAQSTSFGVEEGDLILVGTDGLFDNMNEEMILQHLSKLRDPKIESVQMVANNMAKSALDLAFNPTYMSPFSLNAAANGFDITGGKPDDITVLLSRVTAGNPYDPT